MATAPKKGRTVGQTEPFMKRTLDFQDHRRELGENRYVYAVVSRRAAGLSIGINFNPDKACNFDCPYCQVDRSVPGGSRELDPDRLVAELDHLLGLVNEDLWKIPPFDTAAPALRRVVDLAVAGDGEPTAAPGFASAARLCRERRDAHGISVPLRLLTNATLLHRPDVKEGLPFFDELWCKLDAGTEAYFQQVDGTRLPFSLILRNLQEISRLRPITLQSMFLQLDGEGPTEQEQEAWGQRIREILEGGGKIAEVQVYTVARKPSDPKVGPVSRQFLEGVAAKAENAGLRVKVYGAG